MEFSYDLTLFCPVFTYYGLLNFLSEYSLRSARQTVHFRSYWIYSFFEIGTATCAIDAALPLKITVFTTHSFPQRLKVVFVLGTMKNIIRTMS